MKISFYMTFNSELRLNLDEDTWLRARLERSLRVEVFKLKIEYKEKY